MLMRALIVLLLVLNAGVAAWWWLAPASAPAAQPAHPAGVPRLQLVSEARPGAADARVASAAVPPPASVPDAPGAAAPATVCARLGPFADPAAAEAARAALPAGVPSARVRPQGSTRGAWNVVMPPQPDPAAAQALAQRIDAAGFKDYYVMRDGANANGIALGRFGSAEAAQRHQASLQAAGFAAQVQGPPGATFWVEADGAAGFDPNAVARAIGAAQAVPRPCPAPDAVPNPAPRRPQAVG
jgi:ABC-type transport system substrate-binding protein